MWMPLWLSFVTLVPQRPPDWNVFITNWYESDCQHYGIVELLKARVDFMCDQQAAKIAETKATLFIRPRSNIPTGLLLL